VEEIERVTDMATLVSKVIGDFDSISVGLWHRDLSVAETPDPAVPLDPWFLEVHPEILLSRDPVVKQAAVRRKSSLAPVGKETFSSFTLAPSRSPSVQSSRVEDQEKPRSKPKARDMLAELEAFKESRKKSKKSNGVKASSVSNTQPPKTDSPRPKAPRPEKRAIGSKLPRDKRRVRVVAHENGAPGPANGEISEIERRIQEHNAKLNQ